MRRLVVGLISLIMGATTVAVAAPVTAGASAACASSWRAPVNGDWGEAANWTNGLPTTVACITVPGTYTVSVHGDAFAETLRLGATSGRQVVDIAGHCGKDATLSLGGDNDIDSIVGSHGVIRLRDGNCHTGATLEADRRLINSGLIDVESTYRTAVRAIDGQVANRGTLRIGGAAQLSGNNSIFSRRDARLELRLTPAGVPSMSFAYDSRIMPRTLNVLVAPSFAPTQRTSWTLCSNCIRKSTQITGTSLPNGFVIAFHFRRSHQLRDNWVQATIKRG